MKRRKRPFSVTILVLGVITIALLFWMRFFQVVRSEAFIVSLAPSVSPAYLMLTGLVFGLAGLPTAWGLWLGKRWGAQQAGRYAVGLAVYYWLDFWFFVVSDASRGSWPFAAAVTALGLGCVFWVLSRPGAQAFFNPAGKQARGSPGNRRPARTTYDKRRLP